METNLDILKNAVRLFHLMIVSDLTIRTLEVDKGKLTVLKISRPLIKWYEKEINIVTNELKEAKKELGRMGGKGDLKPINEGDFQVYTLVLRNSIYNYRYSSIALRNHVENELLKRLGLDFIQNPYD